MEGEPTPDDDEIMQRYLEMEAERKSAREENEYDGVQGVPPCWIPVPVIERFRDTRDRVLDDWGYTPCQAREWIERYCRIGQDDDDWFYPGFYPCGRELDPDYFLETIGILAKLRWAISLDQEEGLKELSGEHAVRGYKIISSASKGGKERAEQYSSEKELVCNAAKQISETRCRKPSIRELARLVVCKLYPDLTKEETKKKADSIRRWLI